MAAKLLPSFCGHSAKHGNLVVSSFVSFFFPFEATANFVSLITYFGYQDYKDLTDIC